MKKRVLSLILALVLCVGVLPASASAAEPTDNDRAIIARLPENPGKPILVDPDAAGFMLWELPEIKEEVWAEVEELTHQLISGKSTETEQAKAIFDWVSQNITYDYKYVHLENIAYYGSQSGIKTFYRRTGVCDGYAKLVKIMYVIAGLPTIYAMGKKHGTSTNHAWNAVYADGRWIFLDATTGLWDIDPLYHTNMSLEMTADFCCGIGPNKITVGVTKGYKMPKVVEYPSYADWINPGIGMCPDVETIVIPKNIKLVGGPAFGCENLKSIIFEDGNDCEITGDFCILPVTSVKLPEGVTEAGGYLQSCTYLTDVVIPSTVKKINSFKNCTSLCSLTLPDGVEEISSHAFAKCKSLTEINIPYGVKEIQYETFCECSSLKDITLPGSVTKIDGMAFAVCASLESVFIPSSVTDIDDSAFSLSPKVVIYTEPGSYAETYAKQNNIKVVTSGAPTPTPAPADSSTPSAWAQPEVSEATQAGLVLGDLLSSYTSAITREEFCRLMVKLIEAESGKNIADYVASQSKEISAPFTDTSAQEVKAAYALGIVNGVSATKFNPSGSITRQEAAAMLERTSKLLGITSSGSGLSFTDSGKIASWASGSVAFVSGLTDPTTGGAVMGGVGNGNFGPTGTYTREQAIATTLRLFHCG